MKQARSAFEAAVAKGYRAARVDLADFLVDPPGGKADTPRAMALYEQAWNDGVLIAAFRLGRLYERGLDANDNDVSSRLPHDAKRDWSWYRRGADAAEPILWVALRNETRNQRWTTAPARLAMQIYCKRLVCMRGRR
jgi:TPR repeat protein